VLRHFFAILSALSLILCLTTVGLWVRSYSMCSELARTGWVKSLEGEIEVVYMTDLSCPASVTEHGEHGADLAPDPPRPLTFKELPTGALMAEPTAFGFGSSSGSHFYMQDETFHESEWRSYLFPYWLFVTAFAILPTLWVANERRIRNKRRRAHRAAEAAANSQSVTEPAQPT